MTRRLRPSLWRWPAWPSWPNRRDRRLARRLDGLTRAGDHEPPAGLLRRLADDIPDRWPAPGTTLPRATAGERRPVAASAAAYRWKIAASLAAAIVVGALGVRVLERMARLDEGGALPRRFDEQRVRTARDLPVRVAAGPAFGAGSGSAPAAAVAPAPARASAPARPPGSSPPSIAAPAPPAASAGWRAAGPPHVPAAAVPPQAPGAAPAGAAPPRAIAAAAPGAAVQPPAAGVSLGGPPPLAEPKKMAAARALPATPPVAAKTAPPPLVAPLPPASAADEAAPAAALAAEAAGQPAVAATGGAEPLGFAPRRQARAMQAEMPDGALRSSFGEEAGTAAYRRLRRTLLDDGRLPRVGTAQVEELINAFQPRGKFSAPPGLAAEGAPLPEKAGSYLIRFSSRGLAMPPGQGVVAVEFDAALVARARRLSATAESGSAAALYEVELRRDRLRMAAGGDAPVATLAVRPGALAEGGAALERVVRLSDLRPSWAAASPSLRVQGLAARFGEVLAAPGGVSAERLRPLLAEAQALAAEQSSESRAVELRDLIARAAELAASPAPHP